MRAPFVRTNLKAAAGVKDAKVIVGEQVGLLRLEASRREKRTNF
jgi:hypothetical protein